MKGILHKGNNSNEWYVEYTDVKLRPPIPLAGIYNTREEFITKQIPLSPNPLALPEGLSIDDALVDGKEVDFKISQLYIAPNDSIHNRGFDGEYAVLFFRRTWNEILIEYENSNERTGAFIDFLKRHYDIPTKLYL